MPGDKGVVRVASIYAPNGNPIGTDKFAYKLAWLERLRERARDAARLRGAGGADGRLQRHPDARGLLRSRRLGERRAVPAGIARGAAARSKTSATRTRSAPATRSPDQYTFWDYQAGAWQKDHGIRIDHILLSPQALDRLKACAIDKRVRGREKPSDHVPVWCELEI